MERVLVSNLLHLDASIRTVGSTSRTLTSTYVTEWRQRHPQGGYRYRSAYTLDPAGEHPAISAEERGLTAEIVD